MAYQTLRDIAVTSTYEDVEALINLTVNKFYHKYYTKNGYVGDLEEMRSRAVCDFMRCYDTHDPAKGKFTTWLVTQLHYRMLDEYRDHLQRCNPEAQEGNWRRNEDVRAVNALRLRLHELADSEDEEDEDAQVVLALALEFSRAKQNSPETIREKLWDFLREMGWATARVLESFQEIRNILR